MKHIVTKIPLLLLLLLVLLYGTSATLVEASKHKLAVIHEKPKPSKAVQTPPPVIDPVSPAQGDAPGDVHARIEGKNLRGARVAICCGGQVTADVDMKGTASDTSVPIIIHIRLNALAGPYTLEVSTTGGSRATPFTVRPAAFSGRSPSPPAGSSISGVVASPHIRSLGCAPLTIHNFTQPVSVSCVPTVTNTSAGHTKYFWTAPGGTPPNNNPPTVPTVPPGPNPVFDPKFQTRYSAVGVYFISLRACNGSSCTTTLIPPSGPPGRPATAKVVITKQ